MLIKVLMKNKGSLKHLIIIVASSLSQLLVLFLKLTEN